MSKIPDDIMRMAIDLALDPKTPAVPTNSFPGACAIAEAVLRERARCAKMVREWKSILVPGQIIEHAISDIAGRIERGEK